jgi:hypothetical protein
MSLTRAAFLTGLGIGYVLGAKAGRQRYDQIQRAFNAIRENPTVQETAGVVQAQASGLVHTARDRVSSTLSGSAVGEKLSNLSSNGVGASR